MDLSIMQSVIPDFTIENFNLFDEIICLKWEKVFDDVLWVEYRNLILEMKSCTDYAGKMRYRMKAVVPNKMSSVYACVPTSFPYKSILG